MVTQTWDPNSGEVEAGESDVQGHPRSKFYIRLHPKKKEYPTGQPVQQD